MAKVQDLDLGGPALNEAAWHIYLGMSDDGPLTSGHWNNCKTHLKKAIEVFLERVKIDVKIDNEGVVTYVVTDTD